MISVPNRLRLSNGNKFLIPFLCLFLITCTSCDLFKSTSKVTKTNPKPRKPKTEKSREKEETIVIKTNKDSDPIGSVEKTKVNSVVPRKKSSYDVCLLLPVEQQFFDDDESFLNARNDYYIQYLQGVLMAVDDLGGGRLAD